MEEKRPPDKRDDQKRKRGDNFNDSTVIINEDRSKRPNVENEDSETKDKIPNKVLEGEDNPKNTFPQEDNEARADAQVDKRQLNERNEKTNEEKFEKDDIEREGNNEYIAAQEFYEFTDMGNECKKFIQTATVKDMRLWDIMDIFCDFEFNDFEFSEFFKMWGECDKFENKDLYKEHVKRLNYSDRFSDLLILLYERKMNGDDNLTPAQKEEKKRELVRKINSLFSRTTRMEERFAETEENMNNLHIRVGKLEDENNTLKKDKDNMREELSEAEKQIIGLSNENSLNKKKIDVMATDIVNLEHKVNSLETGARPKTLKSTSDKVVSFGDKRSEKEEELKRVSEKIKTKLKPKYEFRDFPEENIHHHILKKQLDPLEGIFYYTKPENDKFEYVDIYAPPMPGASMSVMAIQDLREKIRYCVNNHVRRKQIRPITAKMWEDKALEAKTTKTHMCSLVVKAWLVQNMKMPTSVVNRLRVVAIYPPKPPRAGEDYPDMLEIVFRDEESSRICDSYMTKLFEHRNSNLPKRLIPRMDMSVQAEMLPRYDALNRRMDMLRQDGKMTYLQYDENKQDFALFYKLKKDKDDGKPFTKDKATEDQDGLWMPRVWTPKEETKRENLYKSKKEVRDTFKDPTKTRTKETSSWGKVTNAHRILQDTSGDSRTLFDSISVAPEDDDMVFGAGAEYVDEADVEELVGNNVNKVNFKEDNMTESEVRDFIEDNDFLIALLNCNEVDEVIDNCRTEISEKERENDLLAQLHGAEKTIAHREKEGKNDLLPELHAEKEVNKKRQLDDTDNIIDYVGNWSVAKSHRRSPPQKRHMQRKTPPKTLSPSVMITNRFSPLSTITTPITPVANMFDEDTEKENTDDLSNNKSSPIPLTSTQRLTDIPYVDSTEDKSEINDFEDNSLSPISMNSTRRVIDIPVVSDLSNSQSITGADYESAIETLRANETNDDDSIKVSLLQVSRDDSVGGEGSVKEDSCRKAQVTCECKDICNCVQVNNLKKTHTSVELSISAKVKNKDLRIYVKTNAEICNNFVNFLSKFDVLTCFRSEDNEVDMTIISHAKNTNTFEIEVSEPDKTKYMVRITISEEDIYISSKNNLGVGKGEKRQNAGIYFLYNLIHSPFIRILGEPIETKADCDNCGKKIEDRSKRTYRCTICHGEIHKTCRGTSGQCEGGCEKIFVFRQQGRNSAQKIKEILGLWPEWKKVEKKEMEKKEQSKKDKIITNLRKDRKKKDQRVETVEESKTGETTVFTTKKAQPKITDQFQRINKSKGTVNDGLFGKGDSHEKTPVIAHQPTKRQQKRREMAKKRQMKKLEQAERKEREKEEGKLPRLSASDNEGDDSDTGEEDLYENGEKDGVKVPGLREKATLYKKQADEWQKKAEDSLKKIEAMKSLSVEERNKLSNESLMASLKSAAGMSKEMLDVSLNARTQLEKHIFTVEKQNIMLRKILVENGLNPEQLLDDVETLYLHKQKEDDDKMDRFMEMMMMMSGAGDEKALEDMKQYVKGNKDREGIEKSTKKFLLVRQERLAGEKEKRSEEKDSEEVQEIGTKDQEKEKTEEEGHKRSVQPPLSEIATKL